MHAVDWLDSFFIPPLLVGFGAERASAASALKHLWCTSLRP